MFGYFFDELQYIQSGQMERYDKEETGMHWYEDRAGTLITTNECLNRSVLFLSFVISLDLTTTIPISIHKLL